MPKTVLGLWIIFCVVLLTFSVMSIKFGHDLHQEYEAEYIAVDSNGVLYTGLTNKEATSHGLNFTDKNGKKYFFGGNFTVITANGKN